MNRLNRQDLSLLVLILVAGAIAAVLLALNGQAQALPALAVGATVGVLMMGNFGPTEE
jgi:hypothetical protein